MRLIAFGATIAVAALALLGASSTAPAGAHPGMRILVGESQVDCSMGPMLIATDGGLWAATAGHCVPHENPEVIDEERKTISWPSGDGPVVVDEHGTMIGRVHVAALVSGQPAVVDVALIQLAPHVNVSTTMPGWDVPQSGRFAAPAFGDRVLLHGHGLLVSDISRHREGWITDADEPGRVSTTLPAAPGDSGGSVVTPQGDVVGVISAGGGTTLDGTEPRDLGYVQVALLADGLAYLLPTERPVGLELMNHSQTR